MSVDRCCSQLRSSALSWTFRGLLLCVLCWGGCGSISRRLPPAFASDSHALQQCINTNHSFHAANWRQLLFDQTSSSIKVERVWWSSQPPAVDLTIITQLSMVRLNTFTKLCQSWNGPISAVVYIPLIQGAGKTLNVRNTVFLQQSMLIVDEFFNRVESRNTCQLQLMLVWEVFETFESSLLYPVNTLRNYALLQAKTSLVMSNDVDLLVSNSLMEELRRPDGIFKELQHNCTELQHAYVVPAFEVTQGVSEKMQVAVESVTGNKHRLQRLQETKQLEQFHVSVPLAHNATDYARMMTTSDPYPVQFVWGYEPWVIAARKSIPLWDVRFRGYGVNKAIQGLHMAQLNFTFMVWPNVWLVHIPHSLSTGRQMFVKMWAFQTDPETSLFKVVTALAKSVLDAGTSYKPVIDDTTIECMRRLPWWYPNNQPFPPMQEMYSQTDYSRAILELQSQGQPALKSLEVQLGVGETAALP